MSVTVTVNGEALALDEPRVSALMRAQGMPPGARGMAIAINGAVVPRRAWPDTTLADGDEIEIVKLFAGG